MILLSLTAEPSQQEKIVHIYKNYYCCMAHTAGKYLRNKADIEDTVHDCIVKLLSVIDTLDTSDEVKLRHLCGVVARNTAINRIKEKRNEVLPLEEVFDISSEDTPETLTMSNETVNILKRAIEALGDTYKDVCRLKYINGLKERQIAALLDLSEKTVNQRIFRGKKILRKALEKESINE